jgi:hypothetical protein
VTGDGIPEDVRAFIGAHVDSVEQLEVLLLLRRTAGREWSAAEVSEELRTSPGSAANRLADLAAHGLITARSSADPLYRYEPRDERLDATLDALGRAYADRRVRVIGMIFEKPIDRIRSFADAFRLWKEDGRG